MLQLMQGPLRGQICMRGAPSRSKLLHEFQQVQDFLLENVPSLSVAAG
jgi:hypothetical protein